jgi:hypothetical protein
LLPSGSEDPLLENETASGAGPAEGAAEATAVGARFTPNRVTLIDIFVDVVFTPSDMFN